jgi:tetratricopeptide (TPR) repeat protein
MQIGSVHRSLPGSSFSSFPHRNQKRKTYYYRETCFASRHHAADQHGEDNILNEPRRWLLGAAAAVALLLPPPVHAVEPFLKSTGARGLLAEEEAELVRLRETKEGEVREELANARNQLESEVKRTQVANNQLCATPFGIDVVGITEFVALTGALVGGLSARRRKQELERLNEQLRTINAQLRQQARAGTLFAPGLTYVPPSVQSNGNAVTLNNLKLPSGAFTETGTLTQSPVPIKLPPATPPSTTQGATEATAQAETNQKEGGPSSISLTSIDEEDMRPEVKQCQSALKEGKKLLKDQKAGPAMVRFEKALMLSKSLGDKVRERRAVRGLAATSRMQGQFSQAIKHLERVLEISSEIGDHVGDADAYGTIADVYTELGEFEKAAEYYDKYISQMTTDGPV